LPHDVAGDRQAGRVGHLRAGDEADAGLRRQAQDVEQPALCDLLDDRRGGRGDVAEAFWSQVAASQSAARAAGSAWPVTKPK